MNRLLRLMSVSFLPLLLAACASIIDTPNQQIRVLTPGAENARCILATQYTRYISYPPQGIQIRRMQDPLKVTCQGPGNREKTIMVYATLNGSALSNVSNAGVGAVYDHASGALYEYPSIITVDFTHTRAEGQGLPAYHARDGLSPFKQVTEDRRVGLQPENPEDQGFVKTLPKKAEKLSKEKRTTPVYSDPGIERPY